METIDFDAVLDQYEATIDELIVGYNKLQTIMKLTEGLDPERITLAQQQRLQDLIAKLEHLEAIPL